jgi:hypothetical protein
LETKLDAGMAGSVAGTPDCSAVAAIAEEAPASSTTMTAKNIKSDFVLFMAAAAPWNARHFAEPFVAQGVGRSRSAGCANEGRKGKRQRGRSAPTRNQASLHHRPPGLRSAFRR